MGDNDLQHYRGNFATLPATRAAGTFAFTQDTKDVYFYPTSSIREKLAKEPSITDFFVFCATTSLGGDTITNGKTGQFIVTGTADGTTVNKLIDSTASFTSALVGEAIWNQTDDTWAKVTAYVSSTELTLSADIFASGEGYFIVSAISNLSDAFNAADSNYQADILIMTSPGSFTDTLEIVGKTPGAAKTLTIQGSSTGTTSIDAEVTIRQKISLTFLTFTKRVFFEFGSDTTWTVSNTTGDDGFIVTKSTSIASLFQTSSNVSFGNDPGNYRNISSTVTIDYIIYVAAAAFGGSDSTNDGLLITQGSATATAANKLIDSTANFNAADHLNKTLYNSTDDTWAKITAIDSTTQVTISVDIMTSGESYKLVAARLTCNGGLSQIPGTSNCNVMLRQSDGTYIENVVVQSKSYSGAFGLTIQGTKLLFDSLTAAASTKGAGATQGTVVRNAGTWVSNDRQHKWVRFTSGANIGISKLIDSNTTTTITIVGIWPNVIGVGDTFVVEDVVSIIDPSTGDAIKIGAGQKGVTIQDLKLTGDSTGYGVNALATTDVIIKRCFSNPGMFTVGTATAYDCLFEGGSRWARVCYVAAGGYFALRPSKVIIDTASTTACLASGVSSFVASEGTILDGSGAATPADGINASANTEFNCWTPDSHVKIKNWNRGLRAESGSQGYLTASGTYVDYSGNTTDISVDANSSHIT